MSEPDQPVQHIDWPKDEFPRNPLLSAFWILAANSWMQTPAGYAVNEAGQFIVTSW